jgi:hypothetical protein
VKPDSHPDKLNPSPFHFEIHPLLQSNALNLNKHSLGQLVHGNTAAGRLVHKELLIGSVHLSKVGHIGQEDVDLDNLGHLGTGGGQDGLDVVAAGLGEFADGASDEGAGGVGGDLAGDEDLAVGADSLRLDRGVRFSLLNWD